MSCSQRDFLTEEADIDLCSNGTIWNTASYGEAGVGVTGRVNIKPVVNKGDQTLFIGNSNSIIPREYMHRHNM